MSQSHWWPTLIFRCQTFGNYFTDLSVKAISSLIWDSCLIECLPYVLLTSLFRTTSSDKPCPVIFNFLYAIIVDISWISTWRFVSANMEIFSRMRQESWTSLWSGHSQLTKLRVNMCGVKVEKIMNNKAFGINIQYKNKYFFLTFRNCKELLYVLVFKI